MSTPATTALTPAPLRDRAITALRARDEAAARAENFDRIGTVSADAFRATHAARVALADLLGMHERRVLCVTGPRGTVVLTVTDDPRGAVFAFAAERTHRAAGHDEPAFRFHVMNACPGCHRLIPVHEIHELADLGAHFQPRKPDEYAHIGIDVSEPGALDPAWHASRCGLLLACHD